MSDINRKPNESSIHAIHTHICPSCKRGYSCNCHTQPDKEELVCRDCEQKGV